MKHQLKSITITKEQIIAAAQLIINKTDEAWEYTEDQVLSAVETWLRCKVSDILADADWHANKDLFDIHSAGKKYQPSFVEEADALVLPEPPEWAHDEIVQRPALQADETGEILWA